VVSEPLTPARAEIVVANAISAGRGVDEPAAPSVDRYMADSAALREEQKVSYGE
jgi:hypothetical protein